MNYKKLSQVLRYSGPTTEDDFHKLLDENPDDYTTRQVLADFLQDRDDPRAEGYRALGKKNKSPLFDTRSNQHAWTNEDNNHSVKDIEGSNIKEDYPVGTRHGLPRQWFDKMSNTHRYWENFDTRKEAEDAAALAFGQLSQEQKDEILKHLS